MTWMLLFGAMNIASAQSAWPTSGWVPIDGPSGLPLSDPFGDVSGSGQSTFEIIGDPNVTNAAGYYTYDANSLYIRIRLGDTPQQSSTKWTSFAFFALLEIDGDTSSGTFDYAILLDAVSGYVVMGANGDLASSWCSVTLDTTTPGLYYQYPAPPDLSGYATTSSAGTTMQSINGLPRTR